MKRLKTAFAALMAAVLLFSALPTTAFAVSNWDYYSSLTREEAFDYIWEIYSYEVYIDDDDVLETQRIETVYSVAYAELSNFLDTYEPSKYTQMYSVYDDFREYFDERWNGHNSGFAIDEDGNICFVDEEGNIAYTFTYDEETDSYIRTGENDSTTVSYPAYHFPEEEADTDSEVADTSTAESEIVTESIEVEVPDSEAAVTEEASDVAGDSQIAYSEDLSAISGTEVTAESESESSSLSSAQAATLIVIGVLIVCGLAVVAVLLVKRGKDGKDNDSSDKDDSKGA